jgi:hypothetical protein
LSTARATRPAGRPSLVHRGVTKKVSRRSPDNEPAGGKSVDSLTHAARVIGSIVAPASLITALMYYFGVQHASWFFQYFGVNYTMMDLTLQDYLIRSADGLFVPLVALAALSLLSLWVYRFTAGRLSEAAVQTVQSVGIFASIVLGAATIGVALVGVLLGPLPFEKYYAVPGLCLAAGVVLLALASNLQRRRAGRPPLPVWVAACEWGALFIVVSVGLFWSVTQYSKAVGTTRGHNTEIKLAAAPNAILYSEKKLSLPSSVEESTCQQEDGSEASYRYKYANLKLIFASSTQYFLLPSNWPSDGSVAMVIPRSESLRLDFVWPYLAGDEDC